MDNKQGLSDKEIEYIKWAIVYADPKEKETR